MPCAETSRTYTTATHLLQVQAPSALIVVASAHCLSSGINLATRDFEQIPMPRVTTCSMLPSWFMLYACPDSGVCTVLKFRSQALQS